MTADHTVNRNQKQEQKLAKKKPELSHKEVMKCLEEGYDEFKEEPKALVFMEEPACVTYAGFKRWQSDVIDVI